MNHLVVFSHLRWDFVFQRPQQLLSRLAADFGWDVIFLEEPIPCASQDHLECIDAGLRVQVLRPHLSGHAQGFHDDHIPALREMMAEHLRSRNVETYWLWFYTPMAVPLAAELSPTGIVYDCMDELAAFRNAPRQLLQRENALLHAADLVFTGGRSLYEAKRERHPRVHCFPSSVDAEHFSRARQTGTEPARDHPLQAHLGRPRLGFFGVVDERLDMALIAALADAHAEWQIVMVGPVVKIDPSCLPQRENIHWLGQQRYADLPDLVAGWDVCLLPFALNEATRFISPTKTLEYLAADRPAVSTPVKDVVTAYADVVAIGTTSVEFIAACEKALAATRVERQNAAVSRAAAVAATSWGRTVSAMDEMMRERASVTTRLTGMVGKQSVTAQPSRLLPGALPLPSSLPTGQGPVEQAADGAPAKGWAKEA